MSLRLGDIAPISNRTPAKGASASTSGWATAGACCSPTPPTSPRCAPPSWVSPPSSGPVRPARVKVLALSVDPVESHLKWIDDINETQDTRVNFPIIADADRKVSELYDLIHPNANDTLTVRSLFIIDPNKKVRLIITYPASTGRNFNEILRVIDSLQLTDEHKVATPANWEDGDEVVIVPSLKDEEEIKRRFPKGYRAVKPYLRLTPQPNR